MEWLVADTPADEMRLAPQVRARAASHCIPQSEVIRAILLEDSPRSYPPQGWPASACATSTAASDPAHPWTST